jgi:hypothetical protein
LVFYLRCLVCLTYQTKPFVLPIAAYAQRNFNFIPANCRTALAAQFWCESKSTSAFFGATSSSGGTCHGGGNVAVSLKQQLKARFPQVSKSSDRLFVV